MNEEQIIEFFEGAKKLLKESKLDETRLGNFFSNLKYRLEVFQDTKKQMDVYLASDFNVFDYIYPYENLLSDIIRDLLDPKGKHGRADVFLREFLKVLSKNSNNVKYEELDTKRATLIREYSTTIQRRIDIVINFSNKYGTGIENKPWAGHQPKQLEHYSEYLGEQFIGNYMLLYLSPYGELPPEKSISEKVRVALEQRGKFKTLSYYTHFKDWLESCYKECKAEKVRWFLRDFIGYVEGKFKQDLSEGREEE